MKNLYNILIGAVAIIIFTQFTLSAKQYWKKIENIPAPYNNTFWLDVQFLETNPNYGWVCGFSGRVIRTTDGGNTWQGTTVAANANHLEHVHFLNTSVGYVSGPAGVFKSINGGVTFTDITPEGMISPWGNYFVNINYGVVLEGGCDSSQKFWLTTDGGDTWTLFEANEPNSGLTDAIIFSQNGLGFAVSSGNLWQTSDGGKTWDLFADTGTNIWHEEITYYDGSFLLPYAGTTCTGQGADGGMRFTTNNGLSWNNHRTGVPMFGSFIFDKTRGWAVGNNANVHYTSNAGVTWILKNCGIASEDHLDDVWFITEQQGWAVGDGVFKMVPAEYFVNKDSLKFENVCNFETKRDTVALTALSFEDTNINLLITGQNSDNFRIIGNPNNIASCNEVKIIIEYSPNEEPEHSAILEVKFNPGISGSEETHLVYLKGKTFISTAIPEEIEKEINPAYCSQEYSAEIIWTAKDNDQNIINVEQRGNVPQIVYVGGSPLNIKQTGTASRFTIMTTDTGWVERDFVFHIDPCDFDTIVTIRAYGVSPIINTTEIINFKSECLEVKYDTLEIKNTGNDILIVSNLILQQANINFSIFGTVSGASLPYNIPVGESEFVILQYTPQNTGTHNATLNIINNDATTARGVASPKGLEIVGISTSPIVSMNKYSIDFGRVCIGEFSSDIISITNSGDDAVISEIINENTQFEITTLKELPFDLDRNQSSNLIVVFTPKSEGEFSETMKLVIEPCGEILELTFTGKGVKTHLDLQPKAISTFLQVLETKTETIVAFATDSLRVIDVLFNPVLENLSIAVEPELHLDMLAGQSANFNFIMTASHQGIYEFDVCFIAEGECPYQECIPFKIFASDKMILADRDTVDFNTIYCEWQPDIYNVVYTNMGFSLDTIINIDILQSEEFFVFADKPSLPIILEPEESVTVSLQVNRLNIAYGQQEALLQMTPIDEDNIIVIPLLYEYFETNSQLAETFYDFGILELCALPQYFTTEITNTGNLDDVLRAEISIIDGFSILNEMPILVPSGETVEIIFEFDPGFYTTIGKKDAHFVLKSEICENKELYMDFEAELIRPILTYTPSELIFDSKWYGLSETREIEIQNNSLFDKYILELNIEPTDFFEIVLSEELPLLIPGQTTRKLPIRFNSNIIGNIEGNLEIIQHSVCFDTNIITLKGLVPPENYEIFLYMNDYIEQAGTIFDLYIELSDSVPFFNPSRIKLGFDYDLSLMKPIETYMLIGEEEIMHPFNLDFGRYSIEIERNDIQELFERTGPILKLVTKTFAASPTYTDLAFTNFDYELENPETVNLTLKDGSLTVEGFCEPVYAFGFKLLPEFEVNIPNKITHSELEIEINSSAEQVLYFEIVDVTGITVSEFSKNIQSGDNVLQLKISEFHSGVYFISIGNRLVKTNFEKFMLVK